MQLGYFRFGREQIKWFLWDVCVIKRQIVYFVLSKKKKRLVIKGSSFGFFYEERELWWIRIIWKVYGVFLVWELVMRFGFFNVVMEVEKQ